MLTGVQEGRNSIVCATGENMRTVIRTNREPMGFFSCTWHLFNIFPLKLIGMNLSIIQLKSLNFSPFCIEIILQRISQISMFVFLIALTAIAMLITTGITYNNNNNNNSRISHLFNCWCYADEIKNKIKLKWWGRKNVALEKN